jgi:hypothetical protein
MRHEAEDTKKAARRPYKAPRLAVFGTVAKITQGKPTGFTDSAMSMM